jgi:hypothetical protein
MNYPEGTILEIFDIWQKSMSFGLILSINHYIDELPSRTAKIVRESHTSVFPAETFPVLLFDAVLVVERNTIEYIALSISERYWLLGNVSMRPVWLKKHK